MLSRTPALDQFPAAPQGPRRRLQRLRAAQSMRLMAGVPLGRIMLTLYGVPTIRPVNHIVDGENVIFRTHAESAVVEAIHERSAMVAYEADEFDFATRLGWSVAVTGMASLVEDPQEADRYLALTEPWLDGGKNKNRVIRIRPEVIFGYRVIADDGN